MIKIEKSEPLISIVNKIYNCKDEEIILSFPSDHPVLLNYHSLKILKNAAGKKRIIIVGAPAIAKKIGASLGIYFGKHTYDIPAQDKKKELLYYNFSFWEFFLFELKKYKEFLFGFFKKKDTPYPLAYYQHQTVLFKATGLSLILIGIILSIGLFLFIFYFAVAKTYVYISPNLKKNTQSINIVFVEGEIPTESISQQVFVPLKKVTTTITLAHTQKTSGIDTSKTPVAKGTVLFINELRDEQVFRPKTRVKTEDGIIFETQDWVKIPGKMYHAGSGIYLPGEVAATVVARMYDEKGQFVGERGNIATGYLTIPGLKYNQDKIYARVLEPFHGGSNTVEYIVDKKDIDHGVQFLKQTLKKEALDGLKKEIEILNKKSGTKYELFQLENLIKYSEPTIFGTANIFPGKKLTQFTLTGTITIQGYVYDKSHVLRILESIIQERLLIGTDKLISIEENSLRFSNILEKKTEPFSMKVTTEIDTWVSFDFSNNDNYYTQRLKTLILGLTKEEAENILLSDEKILQVQVKNVPFFFHRVTSNVDNIIFKIEKEN